MLHFYDSISKTWIKAMGELVANENFARGMGEQMQISLEMFSLTRRMIRELTEKTLEQMSIPTYHDIAQLSDRLTHLEKAVDDLDSKLDEALDLLRRQPDENN
jgi:uncharacterized protein Yka (UPF0111/DUF47 family)